MSGGKSRPEAATDRVASLVISERMMRYSDSDLVQMSLTVWAEARGEPQKGIAAVAWVIRNRFEHPRWWSRNAGDGIQDDTLTAVVRDPYQFSCWNQNDPQREKLLNPKTLELEVYKNIQAVCQAVLDDKIPDPTNCADHYCVSSIVNKTKWAKGRKPCAVIGNHSFFRIEL